MEELLIPYLNSAALVFLLVLATGGLYVIIYIHDIPYEIAKKRNHPHLDAIHVAGWVSLFLMHTIWPFLWIWAYSFKEGSYLGKISIVNEDKDKINDLVDQVALLKEEMKQLSEKIEPKPKKQ
ncbi:MAG: DUF3302 domain-containing protein [Reichenbachiella sp.]